MGLILLVINLPGVYDDVRTWRDWINADSFRWLLAVVGLAIIVMANVRPVRRMVWDFVGAGASEPAEFFPTRDDVNRSRGGLVKELAGVKVAWAAWFAGTAAQAAEVFERTGKPQKLILLDPWGKHIKTFAGLFRRSPEELSSHIITTTRRAHDAGVKTFWFDGPLVSLLFGDPDSHGGWARIEIAFPLSAERSTIFLRKADHPDFYGRLRSIYDKMLDSSDLAYKRIESQVKLHYERYRLLRLEVQDDNKAEHERESEWKHTQAFTAEFLRSTLGEGIERLFLDAGSGYGKTLAQRVDSQMENLSALSTNLRAMQSTPDTEGSPIQ